MAMDTSSAPPPSNPETDTNTVVGVDTAAQESSGVVASDSVLPQSEEVEDAKDG